MGILQIVPVLPSADIERDVRWYREKTGFEPVFVDRMYAVLMRGDIYLHLQWHADTDEDPLLGGSVIRIIVDDIEAWLDEFVRRGTVTEDDYRPQTPWGTNEFGFFDPTRNAVFIVGLVT